MMSRLSLLCVCVLLYGVVVVLGQQYPTIDKTTQGVVSTHTWYNADQTDQKIGKFARNIVQPLTVQIVKDTFQSSSNTDDTTISYQRLRLAGMGTFWQATFGVPGVWIDLRTSVRGSYTLQDFAAAGVTYNTGSDITFNITYINTLPDSYDIIHAHGITARDWRTDGAAFLTDMPLAPMESRTYTYTIPWSNSGTYFMHSHWGFNALHGVTAPLVIVTDAPTDYPSNIQTILNSANLVDAVMFLEDWCLQMPDTDDAESSNANLDTVFHREPYICHNPMLSLRAMWGEWNGNKSVSQSPDLNNRANGIPFPRCEDPIDGFEFDFAYFLANGRQYQDSVSRKFQGNEWVRLRIINAGALTTYRVIIPSTLLSAQVIAVDGHYITPANLPPNNTLWIAVGQRLDVLFQIPDGINTTYVITAVQETPNPADVNAGDSTSALTAVSNPGYSAIALYRGDDIKRDIANITTPGLLAKHPEYILQQENNWHAWGPGLGWPPTQSTINFTLDLNGYNGIRGINGQGWMLPPIYPVFTPDPQPFKVHSGDKVCLNIHNCDHEVHPIHLHGHTFQVMAINNTPISGGGAWRDTIQVPVRTTVTVCFNANAAPDSVHQIHCHMLLHEMSGMQATIQYENYQQIPNTYTGALDAYTKGFNLSYGDSTGNTSRTINYYFTSTQASNTSDLTKTGLGVGLALGLSLLLSWIFFGCAFYRYSQQHHYRPNIPTDGRPSVSAPAGKVPNMTNNHHELEDISQSRQ